MPIDRPTIPRITSVLVAGVLATVLALGGCGGKKAADTSAKAKTAVGEQVGLAAGTARAKLFAPAVTDGIAKGAPNRTQALADAANASEYTVRAIAAAQRAAAKDPELKALSEKLLAASASIGALTVVLRSGKTPPASLVKGSLGTIDSMENALRDAGIPFKERAAAHLSGT